ncbi:helix-turn-helix domain-containing protein [Fictibacillus sp. KIGAM418]|uniref:Helix-turn-helix domain-containing protein n=1 Tax=Fictibacillus marinisediminis TaxID=2878389 RepID=A0A9X1XBI0_9BACL|nr:helix-turn-helix transcriptional regulator [Fictibacillus marinisediminis]MCK6256805.1 helix-turn-helix domain-containing protein [Fictibacillus marinisediminis]
MSNPVKLSAYSIKLLRIVQGMSQKELAERAGIDPKYLSRIERGARPLTPYNALKLRGAIDLSDRQILQLLAAHKRILH